MRLHVPGMFAALTRDRNTGSGHVWQALYGVHCSLVEGWDVVDEESV